MNLPTIYTAKELKAMRKEEEEENQREYGEYEQEMLREENAERKNEEIAQEAINRQNDIIQNARDKESLKQEIIREKMHRDARTCIPYKPDAIEAVIMKRFG